MKDEMDFEMYGASWIYRVVSVVIDLFRGKHRKTFQKKIILICFV